MTRNEILRILQENRKIIIGHGVKRMGIFGSYARDEQTPGSDIDLLVELDQVTLKEYLDLKEFLERLLEHRVDLVLSDTLTPRLRPVVLKEAIYVKGL